MSNQFNAEHARENSKPPFYTYETLLDKILVGSENMSKSESSSATFIVDQFSLDSDTLNKVESELTQRGFKVSIKPHMEDKTLIIVNW